MLEVDERATESPGSFEDVNGECNKKNATHVFQGMDRDLSGEIEFECSTNPNLCDCLVWVGEEKATAEFIDGNNKLVLKGDGTGVRYGYYRVSRRRRRLLGSGHGEGTC